MPVLGRYTSDDVRDLIAAKDFAIKRIQQTAETFLPQWRLSDPDAADAWELDWGAFLQRYADARGAALAAVDAFVPHVTGYDDEYETVLRALTAEKGGAYAPSDLQGLYDRLVKARKAPIDFSGGPKPRAADFDSAYYAESGKVGSAAAGAVAGVAKAADSGVAKSEALDKYFAPLAITVVGGLVTLVLAKKYL